MNNKGYAIKELIILLAIIAVGFGVAITRISFAYQDINNEEEILEEGKNTLKIATEAYIKTHEKDFKKDSENFLYGKDLADDGYLILTEDFDYKDTKIKVTYDNTSKKYNVDILDE